MNIRELVESRIVQDPDIEAGKARIRGTKITVADILLSLAEGLSEAEILRAQRALRTEDIRAAIAYSYCKEDSIRFKLNSEEPPEPSLPDKSFEAALEAEASIQEEITKNKIAEIREEKAKNAKPKLGVPDKKDYEFEINISETESLCIFRGKEKPEQALKMKHNVYIFELRSDGREWLTYSDKDGIELDSSVKRKIQVTYKDAGLTKTAIFDGYLTNDRHHKVFIQRRADGTSGGRGV